MYFGLRCRTYWTVELGAVPMAPPRRNDRPRFRIRIGVPIRFILRCLYTDLNYSYASPYLLPISMN